VIAARSFMAAHACALDRRRFELLFDGGEFVSVPYVPIATPKEATGMAPSMACASTTSCLLRGADEPTLP
jgi:hypothetical protein